MNTENNIQLPIHKNIEDKLNCFLNTNKIPHIIFHGSSGTGKRTIVYNFLNCIYKNDKQKIKSNVMFVNCAHGKGIKFIRDELKFFAKSNIQANSGVLFKSIILMNADFLTIDAQSALRRCIELFSYNTRFFIIVENKHKLLNPILSRFCEIYVPEYIVNNKVLNLHQYDLSKKIDLSDYDKKKMEYLSSKMELITPLKNHPLCGFDSSSKLPVTDFNDAPLRGADINLHRYKIKNTYNNIIDISNDLYENGISCIDLMEFIETCGWWDREQIIKFQMEFYNIKSEYRCEKLLMLYILDMVLM
jgi:hypothetical protein